MKHTQNWTERCNRELGHCLKATIGIVISRWLRNQHSEFSAMPLKRKLLFDDSTCKPISGVISRSIKIDSVSSRSRDASTLTATRITYIRYTHDTPQLQAGHAIPFLFLIPHNYEAHDHSGHNRVPRMHNLLSRSLPCERRGITNLLG